VPECFEEVLLNSEFAIKTDKMSAVIGNSAYKSLMLFRR
jgi:hypothetical protein